MVDTLQIAEAYVKLTPPDAKDAVWFYARALNFAPDSYKPVIEKKLDYWYKKFHGAMDGLDGLKAAAAATVFPPGTDFVKAAATPAEKIHDLLATTANWNSLALADKETVLAVGSKEDADKLWALLKDQPTPVPGMVMEAQATGLKVLVTHAAKTHAAGSPGAPSPRGGLDDDGSQPAQLIDQAYDRARRCAQAGRAVRCREELRVQRIDRSVGAGHDGTVFDRVALGPEDARDVGTQPCRQRPAGFDRPGPQRLAAGAGHSRPIASSAAPAASPQPARRSGIDDAGAASETGRMNASSNDVVAEARTELTTPANRTAKPTSAIESAPTTSEFDASVPRHTNAPQTTESAAWACKRPRIGPLKSTSRSIANEPKAANVATIGLPIT